MDLVILDRDGVINFDSDDYIKSPDEWQAIPGSLEAIAHLNHSGYRVVVASNQSGLARGLFDIATLHAIHQKMHDELAGVGGYLDAVLFCPHGPDQGCACRKPAPGLLLDISRRFCSDLTGVYAVGDALRDIEAARTAGASPVLVRTGKGQHTLTDGQGIQDVPVYADLSEAVERLILGGC